MPMVKVNEIEICFDCSGPDEGPPLLLVMGLGAQMTVWNIGFVSELVDRGFRVIRFDNRDAGLSSKTVGDPPDVMALYTKALAGEQISAPYTLSTMADDAVGLLDALEIPAAHVVGASMGGMIVQMMAIEHPNRLLSMTSIMSTTGGERCGAAHRRGDRRTPRSVTNRSAKRDRRQRCDLACHRWLTVRRGRSSCARR